MDFDPEIAEDHITATKTYRLRALDLTDETVRSEIGVTREEITIRGNNKNPNAYEKTQKIGDIAKNLGYDAVVYPSAEKEGGEAIVIFDKGLIK